MLNKYNFLSRKLISENRVFEVFFDKIKLKNSEIINNFLIIKPKKIDKNGVGGVCILPEVSGKIGLMKTWRHQLNCEIWQAPAGFIERNESAVDAAKRELFEETGLKCIDKNFINLGCYFPDAGLIESSVALFFAKDCYYSDDVEIIEETGIGNIEFFDRKALLDLTKTSSFFGGSTLVACYRFLLEDF